MIWILLLVALGLAGLPWFAALGLTLLVYSAYAGLDPLLIMLEFSRLAEMQDLLAIPMLLWGLGLLQIQSIGAGRSVADAGHGQAAWAWSGKWLLQASRPGTVISAPSDIAALLFAASPPLILVWLVFGAVTPGHAPPLQHLLLAALVTACFVAIFTAVRWPGPGRRGILGDLRCWLIPFLLLVPLAGVYSGHWPLLDAAGAAVAMVLVYGLLHRTVSIKEAVALMLESLKVFGRLALVLGLGLSWFALAFDHGIDRQWLNGLTVHLQWPFLTAILAGIWLSAVWMLGAWLLRPLPALIVGAPWLFPVSAQSGLAGAAIVLVTLLSLYAGYQLRTEQGARVLPLQRFIVLGVTILLILTAPVATQWL